MSKNFLLVVGLLALLGGCSHYSLKKPDTHKVGSSYSVRTTVEWNKYNKGRIERWTQDGLGLDELALFEGISEGEPLFPIPSWDKKQLALASKFTAEMRASDVMEFVIASIIQQKAGAVEGHNLRPANFGSLRGFRFEVSYLGQSGLEMKGTVVGAVEDGKLHLVMFTAPKLYFFGKGKDLVEQIINSIEII